MSVTKVVFIHIFVTIRKTNDTQQFLLQIKNLKWLCLRLSFVVVVLFVDFCSAPWRIWKVVLNLLLYAIFIWCVSVSVFPLTYKGTHFFLLFYLYTVALMWYRQDFRFPSPNFPCHLLHLVELLKTMSHFRTETNPLVSESDQLLCHSVQTDLLWRCLAERLSSRVMCSDCAGKSCSFIFLKAHWLPPWWNTSPV